MIFLNIETIYIILVFGATLSERRVNQMYVYYLFFNAL